MGPRACAGPKVAPVFLHCDQCSDQSTVERSCSCQFYSRNRLSTVVALKCFDSGSTNAAMDSLRGASAEVASRQRQAVCCKSAADCYPRTPIVATLSGSTHFPCSAGFVVDRSHPAGPFVALGSQKVSASRLALVCERIADRGRNNCCLKTKQSMARVQVFVTGSATNSESACSRECLTWSDAAQSLPLADQCCNLAIELERNLRCSLQNSPSVETSNSTGACLDGGSFAAFAGVANVAAVVDSSSGAGDVAEQD